MIDHHLSNFSKNFFFQILEWIHSTHIMIEVLKNYQLMGLYFKSRGNLTNKAFLTIEQNTIIKDQPKVI